MYGEIYYAFYRSQVITLGKRDRSRVKKIQDLDLITIYLLTTEWLVSWRSFINI